MSKSLTITSLTDPREVAFVVALFELGGPMHGTEAAMRAGYADTPEEASRAAGFLLGSSRISRVVTGEIKARFDVAAAAAFKTLLEICSNPAADAPARIAAAKEILNWSSVGPVISRSAVLKTETGIEDLLAVLDRQEQKAAHPLNEDQGAVIEGSPEISIADSDDA